MKIIPRTLRFPGQAFVTGFHGIGATGYWTIKYLVQKLEARRVGFVDFDVPAPISSSYKGKIVTPYELFSWKNLTFFKAESPPFVGPEIVLVRDFARWVMKAGFGEAVLIGGLDANLRADDSTHRIAHTSAYEPKGEIAKAKVLEDEQLIVGPVALLLNYFEIHKFPAYAILSYSSTERVDPRAAASAIEVLSKHFDFGLDLEPLIKGAEALESAMAGQEARPRRGGESIYT